MALKNYACHDGYTRQYDEREVPDGCKPIDDKPKAATKRTTKKGGADDEG